VIGKRPTVVFGNSDGDFDFWNGQRPRSGDGRPCLGMLIQYMHTYGLDRLIPEGNDKFPLTHPKRSWRGFKALLLARRRGKKKTTQSSQKDYSSVLRYSTQNGNVFSLKNAYAGATMSHAREIFWLGRNTTSKGRSGASRPSKRASQSS